MAVLDDVRRLSQMDAIFLGMGFNFGGAAITNWHKGRLQQANDGSWIFRSISADGTMVGTQLGPVGPNWSSSESPAAGLVVSLTNNFSAQSTLNINLQQQLPQELT
jgi:hypothetical protein